MSAPVGGGGFGAASLSGAAAIVAQINSRGFMLSTGEIEAVRADWDGTRRGSVTGAVGANTNIDAITPGRGTWALELVVCDRSPELSQATFLMHLDTVANGYPLDICGTAYNGHQAMSTIVALGQGQQVNFATISGIPAGVVIDFLWLFKRLTR